ncbi:flagellar biosynthetic protein FliO [Aurantimonas coralicida]|uniref:flagellar biosynthetic protein FliO n=1 Tax=Aurantimonas coralicida TaxID=182270 RepID=UPI001D1830FF|nr:flagellar biosynthetic protein FliO [Aurantimonas coralicida]MCC4296410.1 flagellar biosynthetic protein FliO [Aurantimonas coralicida]
MPQWIVDLVGEGLAPIVWVAIVAVIVCGLAMAMIVLAKKAFGGRIGTQFKGRAPRLAVMDVTRIDEKRKLVLVRRDEIEHLILIGGQNDVLLEGNILRVPAAARPHGDWNTSRSDEIEEERFARNHRHEPELPAVAERARAPEPWIDAPAPRETKPTPPERAEAPSADAPSAGANDRRSPPPVATPSPLAAAGLATAATGAAANGDAASVPVDSPSPDTRPPAAAAMPEPVAPPAPPRAPIAARPVTQPRSMATPTAMRAPDIGPATAQQDTASGPAPASRVEPRFAAARSQPEPSAPDSETARTQLRAQMNRSQSPEFSRVQDATAPAIAVEPADSPVAARQPLSVRSFASAIQQRKAPPEMPPPATPATPAPTPRPAPAAPASAAPASAPGRGAATAASAAPSVASPAPEPEAPKPEVTPAAKPEASAAPASEPAKAPAIEAERADPSLEDFLSAELDTDFGDDDGDEDVAPPRGNVPAPAVDVPVTGRPERAPESRDVPKVDATSRSPGASTWPQAPTPVVAKAEDAKPSPAPAPSIDAPSREPAASPRPMPEPARVEPETRADRDTADESAPDAPATGDQAPERRLTLEEEMERLLGDFSFDAKGERKPN